MLTKTFRYTVLALNVLEKILGSRFSVTGIENLPQGPIMFVANHFTRLETFIVPYLIYKKTGRQVRCLADSDLFNGNFLGKFLERVGTISTQNPSRDKIIIRDLISGDYDWMIYPEGSMIKSKEIKREEIFVNNTPYRTGPVRTGSAVLALKSNLYRQDLIEANIRGDTALLKEFDENYHLQYSDQLKLLETHIIPLTITYYPIRPGHNKIELFAKKFVEKIPPRLAEELEIEGNLLESAEMNLHFSKAINLKNYSKTTRDLILQIPIIKNETKNDIIIKYFKHRLTTEFMEKIYLNLQINLDHIFSSVLQHFPQKEICVDHLKKIIYISALMIKKTAKYRINSSIEEENLIKIFSDEPHQDFDSAFQLAKELGEIEEIDATKITINKSFIHKRYDFHKVRLENTLQVIANEFALLDVANNIVKHNCKTNQDLLRQKAFNEIVKKDQEIYENDYQVYYDKNFSKDRSVGRPYFMDSHIKSPAKIKKIGILICHGYKSSPKEVESLAKFFNGFGFKVYAVRMKGHGTSPVNIQDTNWHDWYDSLQRGYAALKMICAKVVIVGFSTGGLIGLLSTAQKKSGIAAIVSINSALKLKDIRSKMVHGINLWNDLLDKFHIHTGKFEYIDSEPEIPEFNYSRNYIKGVGEIEKLMKECRENLPQITIPALIIQARHDPVVDPLSGVMIYERILSKDKFLFEPDFSNHVIINGERKEEIFALIKEFLHKMKLV